MRNGEAERWRKVRKGEGEEKRTECLGGCGRRCDAERKLLDDIIPRQVGSGGWMECFSYETGYKQGCFE